MKAPGGDVAPNPILGYCGLLGQINPILWHPWIFTSYFICILVVCVPLKVGDKIELDLKPYNIKYKYVSNMNILVPKCPGPKKN